MRSFIFSWVRTLAAYFIFMTMVLNFIPEGQYRKYVRYFFSLLLIFLLTRPLGALTGWEEAMSESLGSLVYGLEYQENLGAGLYVGETQRQLVEQACQERIEEQTEELLAEYGLKLVSCVSKVELKEDDPGIRSLYVRAQKEGEEGVSSDFLLPDQEADKIRVIKERLMDIYGLSDDQVSVSIQ